MFVRITLLALLVTSLLFAQAGGGSVIGVVTDPQDATIAGAKVKATNVGTNVVTESVTNEGGYYEFPLLQAGSYRLSVEREGFQAARSDDFVLNTGSRPRFDFRLQVGSITETVQVSAAAPLVNATTTDLGVVMQTAKIENLPLNGRNFQQLVSLQAGVLNTPPGATGGRGGIEFNGSPSYGNNLLLDGVDMSFGENNALGTGAAGAGGNGTLINTISVEAIQEFKAIGSAFSAEYGRSTGGVLNVTTKSGTNRFHGTLYHFLRNDKLDANSFFNNRSNLPKPPLRLNQYGGNIGGPIKRDRMFFFFNYEGATLRQGQSVVTNVPTPLLLQQVRPAIRQHLEGSAPITEATTNPLIGLSRRNDSKTNDENTYVSRVDYNFSKHQLSVRYNYNNQKSEVPQPRPDNRFTFPLRYHNAAIQDAWAISPNLFNELRLGFNRTSLNRNNSTLYTQPGWVEVTQGPLNSDFQSQLFFLSNNYTIADNFTWVRGSHTIKTGFEIRDNRTARVQSTNVTHFYTTLADLIIDSPRQVRVTFGNPGGELYSTNYGFFIQDDWRLSRRLQLNLGLRYEYYTPLTGGFNIMSSDPFGPIGKKGDPMFDPDRNNFGPRLGVVWDVAGDQKTVVRAGGGISFAPPQPFFYYDRAFISPEVPFNAFFTPQEVPSTFSLAFPFPQTAFNAAFIANPVKGLVTSRFVDDFQRADEYAGQWNLSVQRQITSSLAVQTSYVGSRGMKLLTTNFPNLFAPNGGPRPRPEFSDVGYHENSGRSAYHALQISANQRAWRGLTLDAYYTWAKSLAYFGADANDAGSREGTVQDFNNIANSYGPKVSDLRHRAVVVFGYDFGTIAGSGVLNAIFGGWNTQGFWTMQSGFPVNVVAGADLVGNRRPDNQRPDLVGGVDPYLNTSDRLAYLNPAAFDSTAARREGRFGNLGYNALRAPGGMFLDAAIHKNFRIAEGHQINFRFEAFNAMNHAVLGAPVNNITNPNFGRILSSNGGRNLQLALKYRF